MFSTYLLIGLIVQILTCIERFARGVATIEKVKECLTNLNITYEVNGNTYNSKSDLDTAINRLDTGKYSIKYIVTYRGETDNLIRTITIK